MNIDHLNDSPRDSTIEKQSHDAHSPPEFTPEMEKRVLRKMDLRLIPMLSLLYLLAFLDRGNIGNAKIEGLLEDLNMTGPQYSWTCRQPSAMETSGYYREAGANSR